MVHRKIQPLKLNHNITFYYYNYIYLFISLEHKTLQKVTKNV